MIIQRGFVRQLLLSLLCSVFVLPLSAAVAADYDGDGKDDLEVVQVLKPDPNENKGETRWYIRKSKTGKVSVYKFKVPAAAFVRIRRTDKKLYPGIVWVRSVDLPLEWYVKARRGESKVLYGLPGDMIPPQGDIDRDGVTDLTVIRNQGGSLQWHAKVSKTGQVRTTMFGTNGVKAAVGPDGMLMIVDPNFTWSGRFFDASTLTVSKSWGLAGDIPLFGVSAGQVAVARDLGATQKLFVSNLDGTSLITDLGPVNSIPTIGKFFSSSLSYGWHSRDQKQILLKNSRNGRVSKLKLGSSQMSIVLPSGQVIPVGQDGKFGSGGNNGGGSNGGGNGGNGGGNTPGGGGSNGTPPSNPGLASVCPTVRDALGGEIWKSIASTHIPTSDPRRFSTSFITRAGTPAPSTNCVSVYDGRGNLVHQLGKYSPTGSAYSSRNYGGSGCGDKRRASDVAAQALSQAGSITVYVKVKANQCVRIPNPNGCVNSSQC